jgi:protein phosphatase 4 regulatory subunit 3
MPRDNLLNSACLEFFEFIKRENMKDLTISLVEQFREKLEGITYVDTFRQLLDKYEKYTAPPPPDASFTSVDTEQTQNRGIINGGQRWQGLKDADTEEEAYFNGSDNEDEEPFSSGAKPVPNGASPIKPLVNYPDDDDDGTMDILAQDTSSSDRPRESVEPLSPLTKAEDLAPVPERLAEKRRREEDEEDELSKLSTQTKRRSSSISSIGSAPSTHGQTLRRKKSINSGKDGPPKKISISLAVKSGNTTADSE